MVNLGAETKKFDLRPLEIGKDKFARNVLQNLNDAATEANDKDVNYLVNCGENIDNRHSIAGHAPIHKAVLGKEARKIDTLNAILENRAKPNTVDSNGWSALHHACHDGDRASADILIKNEADVNCFSTSGKTPLHMAAMRNQSNCIQLLL
jgi:ankyrin repeat protein